MIRASCTICLAMLLAGVERLVAQNNATNYSIEFSRLSVIQYIVAAGNGPRNILELDNNGAIALASRNGITRDELRKRVAFSESQIELLKAWRLLRESNDTLRSTFPVLDSVATTRLRDFSAASAPAIVDAIEPDVRVLTHLLGTTGRADNAYSILFSYILDGLVWTEFERRALVQKKALTAESPFWSGVLWALHARRTPSPGTNSLSERGFTLKITWSEAAISLMLPFVSDFTNLEKLFSAYRVDSSLRDASARAVFAPYGLFDANGVFTIPRIRECLGDSLYTVATRIASRTVASAAGFVDAARLTREFGLDSPSNAWVIVYHELMWDILDELQRRGLARIPRALKGAEHAVASNVAALIFGVEHKAEGPGRDCSGR